MALVAADLAQDIVTGLGESMMTTEVMGFAVGIVDEVTSATASFDSGTPGPHTISGMTGSSLAGKIKAAAGYPSISAELLGFSTAICDHIQNDGQVFYTGPPPPAVPDYFLGGLVSGLDGSVLAALAKTDAGWPSVSAKLLGMCTAIADYIVANAEVVSGVIS